MSVPFLVRALGRSYGPAAPDLLVDLSSQDRSVWENALVELTFRHMVAAASAGGLWAAAGALADARTPQLLPVVGGIGAGVQAVLLVSLLWLTREGQPAGRLNRPPADILQGKVVMRFLPLAVGLVVALLWLLLLG